MTPNVKLEASISNEWYRKFHMSQMWGNHKRKLQRLEGGFNVRSPSKRLILPSQTSKMGHYHEIMCNETLIEVSKSKKTLNIMNRKWDNPIFNDLNRAWIHANALSKNDVNS